MYMIVASSIQGDFQILTVDPVLPCVILYMRTSWPEDNSITAELCPYYDVRGNLPLTSGILFEGEKLVIPIRLH